MIELSFSKYEGAGNDFVLIDDRAPHFPTNDKQLIQRLCDRRFGVGADGVILLQNDPVADARMRIFNNDGTEAKGCGNGTRCLVRFLEDLGVSRAIHRIAVGDKVLSAELIDHLVHVEMGGVSGWASHEIDGREIHYIDSGVPHAVWFVSDVASIPLHEVGPLLRRHPRFGPCGANVNLAAIGQERRVRVRTFERGVEGETLACGTGATAVAVIGARLYGWDSPVQIQCSGGDLEIHFDESFNTIRMAGPARKVFEGRGFF